MHWKTLRWVLLAVVVAFLAIQALPLRVTNGSARDEPKWDSPRTRALAKVACFDCHSNEVHVAWFEQVAPLSWWIKSHVDEGRQKLNFSEWSTHHGEGLGDSSETISEGSMPPSYYTWLGMHSDAKLTAQEKRDLIDGLRKTAAQSGGGTGG
ncbi:MAG: heme-binding domain-containing protein [Acidimicrobiia bacterium]